MNRIYKVVWNAARSCYVVGSEFIHSNHTMGGHQVARKSLKGLVTAALIAGVLLPVGGMTAEASKVGFPSFDLPEIAIENPEHEAWQDEQIEQNSSAIEDLEEAFDKSAIKDHKQDAVNNRQWGAINGNYVIDGMQQAQIEAGKVMDGMQNAAIGGNYVIDGMQQAQIEAGKVMDGMQNAAIGGNYVIDGMQQAQIEAGKVMDGMQNAAIGGNYVIDGMQQHQINGLEEENDRQWGAINGGVVHDAMQDGAIIGGMIKDEYQDAAIDHNYDIDKAQGHEIAGLEQENDRQWGAINGGVVHDAMQDGAIIGGMIKDEYQDAAIDHNYDIDKAQGHEIAGLEQENDRQWGAINGGVVHDAIQDGAIIGGIIKDEEQDNRLEDIETVNKGQQNQIDSQHQELDDLKAWNEGQQNQINSQQQQLDDQKAWNEKQDIDIDKVDNKVGDLNYSHNNYVTDGQDVTMAIGDLDKATQEAYEEALKHTTVSGDGNFVVKPSENLNGSTDYKVSLAPNVDIEESLTVGGEEGITINKGDQGTINGLTNTKWEPETHTYEGSDQAATEGQLHDVSEGLQQNIDKVDHKVGDLDFSGTNYVENKDNVTDAITELDGAIKNNQTAVENLDNNAVKYDVQDGVVDKTSVTLGDGQTPTGLHNVAAGAVTATSTDAVNGSQLWEVDQKVNANTSAISGLNSRVDTLDGRIDKVGANAAALAALHPLDFDPDDKWDFAAGVGNYGGENAMAVGAFYRPNEDTMFSVGGSFGTGENMVNAGVSFKIGQGNHISTSRVAMAKEIETLRHNVAQLTELVNKLVGSQDQIQNAMTTPFPDVPENHWAYETIEQMRERGIVEGYPDGTFGGDRQMTRYEFATIVYRALQKGLGMNEELQRLVDEFKPELELIRVDTIAQDSEGNPTIERVRVNKA